MQSPLKSLLAVESNMIDQSDEDDEEEKDLFKETGFSRPKKSADKYKIE